MPARSEQEREFPPFSRSLISEKRLFEECKFARRNQTHEEPDCELPLSGQITLQNRLIESVVQFADFQGLDALGWLNRKCRFIFSNCSRFAGAIVF